MHYKQVGLLRDLLRAHLGEGRMPCLPFAGLFGLGTLGTIAALRGLR